MCPLGKYWSPSPDFQCLNCDVGKYSNIDRTSCLACPAGTSDDGMMPTGQVSTGCNKCKAGQSSSEGSRCQECLPGTISLQDGDACTPCSQGTQYVDATTPCSICEAGTYREIVKYSTIQERTCASCPVGRYLLPSGTLQKKEDHDNITDCTTCPIGREFVGSAEECQLCDASSYQDENGVDSASCKKCSGGKQASSAGSTSADDCGGCVLGTIMSSPTPALQCSTCPSGQYRSTPSNQLGDACVTCDAGYYIGNDATIPSLHDDKNDCALCPKGYEFYNVTKCIVCASGQYKQIPNTDACVACLANYFIADHRQEPAVHDHADDCMACTHGRIAASGAAYCEICQAGKEQVDYTCIDCVAGRFSTSLQLMCMDCPSGYYQHRPSLAFCLPCVPGESQNESGSFKCQACESGYFSSTTTAISCEKCTVGSSTGGRKGAARCEKCGSGTYGASCDNCKSGHYRGAGDPTEQCLGCPSGFYQGDMGQASCLPCVPGMAASNVGSSNCTRCLVNYYTNEIEQKVCKQCESGSFTNGKDGAAMCYLCMGGTYGDDCSACSPGMYRAADDETASSCTSCPSGYYQEKVKQASCLPCIPGRHQPVAKQTSCKKCEINTYAEEAQLTKCKECAVGKYAKAEGSASCQSCEPGKYNSENGNSCLSCPRGWKRSSQDPASACLECGEGQTTYDTSSSSCESCEIGKYQKDKMDCVNCEAGKYQDTKAQDECKTCEQGLIPNKNSTACENPGWKVPKDCDFTTQYLNTSSSNPQDHKCAPCPLGASCENDVNWSGVRAKYGWWRVRSVGVGTGGISPPKCLVREEKNQQALPPCAFVRCPNPHACLGAKNPNKFKNEKLEDPATIDLNESCWYKGGYQTTTCGANHSESCRLCGTCRVGFKRYGEGAKCMECPPSETNRAMLALGFLVMIVGSAILIYMTIKDEESGEKETSDAIKKIILNFCKLEFSLLLLFCFLLASST